MSIAMSAIFSHSGGYAELARNLACCIPDIVTIHDRNAKGFQPLPTSTYFSAEFQALLDKLSSEGKKMYGGLTPPDTLIQFMPPFMAEPTPPNFRRNILVTMFETRVVPEWWEHINKCGITEIWVHDDFQEHLFASTRTSANIEIKRWVPWVQILGEIAGNVCPKPSEDYFLAVGVSRIHKNYSRLIKAWKRLGIKQKLVIKTITEDVEWDDYREELRNAENVVILPGPFSELAMKNLYQHCLGFISPSMCEGLDMPAYKAMMAGKLVLMGAHTGHEHWRQPGGCQLLEPLHEIDMAAIPAIHPRYRVSPMPGYDVTDEVLAEKVAEFVQLCLTTETFSPLGGVFSRGKCEIALGQLL